jgi:putative transposase
LINHKAVARIMRQRQLQVRPLRRFVRTTDSDHDNPGFPNLAADATPTAAKQLWVADLTYVAIAVGFVYVAVILDAWSRRVVGYALARRIDTRLTLAALHAAVAARRPPPGCIHHSGRGGQYAAELYRDTLAALGLRGSMGRRGNPYHNAKAESTRPDSSEPLRWSLQDLTFANYAAALAVEGRGWSLSCWRGPPPRRNPDLNASYICHLP